MWFIRQLLACGCTLCLMANVQAENRTFDGTGNNLRRPLLGSSNQPFVRISYPNFLDDRFTQRPLPNARDVSNAVSSQLQSIPNARGLSDYVWVWGQFLAHDLSLSTTTDGSDINGEMPIPVQNELDPLSPGPINFVRSNFTIVTENHKDINPRFPCDQCREQINENTSFIDASMVYGSTETRAAALRTNGGTGARLRTSEANLLPINSIGLQIENSGRFPDDELFVAGDIRANENPLLTSMHTVFVREHNRLVSIIQQQQPNLNDEETFQLARKIVGAEVQAITYNEYLPVLMGEFAPDATEYRYNSNEIASVTQSFAHAINRWGHSAISPRLQLVDEEGNTTGQFALRDAFFDPEIIGSDASIIDQFLRGAASQVSQEIDVHVVDELRNALFGPPGSGGSDLASLNIQRGRDHGVPPYRLLQRFYRERGLRRGIVSRFSEISSDEEVVSALQAVYQDLSAIDGWIGALAEDHLPGTNLGTLATSITLNQFRRLRDGDRLFYRSNDAGLYDDNILLPEIKAVVDLESITLSDVIRANTSIANLQDDIFFAASFPNALPGDFNGNGLLDDGDIELLATEIMVGIGHRRFDLNQDSKVNKVDHQIWIEEIKQTWFGDANLDGEFNTSDLVNVFQAGEFEDRVRENSTWATGDWNGDFDFDSGDLVHAFQHGGFENGPRAAGRAVPETSSWALLTLALVGIGHIRRTTRVG